MSLSKEQKKQLEELGKHLKKIEELAVVENLDLDVFISEYKESGFAVYATETVNINEKAAERKQVFEKAAKKKNLTAKLK